MELSDEILLSEVLPRWDYLVLFKTRLINRHWYNLYNDDTLWSIKLRSEFPTYQRKDITLSWKHIYRHLVKTRYDFLVEVVDLGMHLRGWQGSRLIYPLRGNQCHLPNYDLAYSSIIKLYELWDALANDDKFIIDDLQFIRYHPETGYEVHPSSLIQRVIQLGLGVACARLCSRDLIVSALYYLKKFYHLDIPNCNIEHIESIC